MIVDYQPVRTGVDGGNVQQAADHVKFGIGSVEPQDLRFGTRRIGAIARTVDRVQDFDDAHVVVGWTGRIADVAAGRADTNAIW